MIADVVAAGARSPLGLTSTQVALCMRARKLEPRAVRFTDKRGQEIGIALVGGLGERLFGYHRMVALAAPALSEAVKQIPALLNPKGESIPLVLCAPERGRPDDSANFDDRVIADVADRSGAPIDVSASKVIRHAQPGFAHAIPLAAKMLDEGASVVCVGGVDSYYHPQVLQWLDAECRLHALGADGGFIPSEGAAFLVLARLPPSDERMGRILDVAVGRELSHDSEEEPNIGEAMTVMLESVQERLDHEFSWTVSDINGERHRTREWMRARGRVIRRESVDNHWVWDVGDVGAASGPLFTTIALKLCQLGCAHAPRLLLALHADNAERGLVAIEGDANEELDT